MQQKFILCDSDKKQAFWGGKKDFFKESLISYLGKNAGSQKTNIKKPNILPQSSLSMCSTHKCCVTLAATCSEI